MGKLQLVRNRWLFRNKKRPKRKDGEGTIKANGYVQIQVNRRLTYEHIYLAEKALGRRLPQGARVHHMNEDKTDNHTPLNLVICPSVMYHQLLHRRMRCLQSQGSLPPDSPRFVRATRSTRTSRT